VHNAGSKSHILIAGLGDLGTGLALALLADGHRVSAIRRQSQASAGIDLYAQDLVTTPAILLPPDQVDLLVIALTPASRDEAGYRDSFLVAPQRLLNALAERQPLPPVIFVSSTAVYGEIEGDVDEDTPPTPSAFNGRILLAAEEELSLRSLLTVVRLAGIHGRGDFHARRAAAIASGEAELPANHWMNRIHRDDCVGLLHTLATTWLNDGFAPSLVVGCDNHPVESHQLYQRLASEQGLTLDLPDNPPASGKRIRSRFIAAEGYLIRMT
jgi:nucleoside-diphosphate-sugar epimerase